MSDTKLNEAISITTSPERLTELVDISIELARAVAANPNAPPQLLQKLSKYDDLETRQNVALNPNTSTDILFKLAQDFPEEFLNNPIFPLLLLENPNLAETIPADTLLELLKVGNVPQVFIEWALQAPSNYKLTSSSTYNYKNWCLAIASNPNNTKVLNKLAQDESLKLQVLVAKHLNTHAKVLIEFAQSECIEKKIAVAKNIKTPLSILKYLALSSKRYEIYETVFPEAIKTIKQRYPEELTNILVAYVEKTPFPTAARLFLLLHKTAPSDFLARHYRSLDWRERYAVAQNPNTSLNILEKLKLDANSIVRATAKARF